MGTISFDLGNLLVEDNQLYDHTKDTKLERIKICCQAIIDELSKLPSKVVDNVTVVELPEPKFLLPREKRIPKNNQPTRWEQFAKLKNIKKKKKPKFAYNEEKGKYMPTWGKGSKEKPWVMEVSDHGDIFENKFAKANEFKRQRIDENETRRLKNIGKNVNLTMNKMHTDRKKKESLKSVKIAGISDASMGKFSRKVDTEKLKKEVAQKFNKNVQKEKPKKSIIKRKPMKKKGSRTGNKKN